jgi:hypothetical protein
MTLLTVFFFGVPRSSKEQDAWLQAVHGAACELAASQHKDIPRSAMERLAWETVSHRIDGITQRITDKSIGLMQFIALVITAISIMNQGRWSDYAVWLVTVLCVAAFFPLVNLFLYWKRDPSTYASTEREIRAILNLIVCRGICLTIAIVLTMIVVVAFMLMPLVAGA